MPSRAVLKVNWWAAFLVSWLAFTSLADLFHISAMCRRAAETVALRSRKKLGSAYNAMDFYDIDSVAAGKSALRNCLSRCAIKASK